MKSGKIKVVELGGSPFEQGLQFGEALKDEMRTAVTNCLGGLGAFYGVDLDRVLARAMEFLPAAESFDDQIRPFVEGQAKGAGLSFEEAFALRCTLEMMFYFQPPGAALCTSFAAVGQATASGETILGQNIDWFTGTPLAVIRRDLPDGNRQLALCLLGISEYTLTSAGFGICANGTAAAWSSPGPRIPLQCYLPRVMRQPSLDKAREVLVQAARGTGYYHLADASGSMFGIESNLNGHRIIEPENNTLAHSNHYVSEEFRGNDMAGEIFPDSFNRLKRMKEAMDRDMGGITTDLMKKALSDHDGLPGSICRHPDENVSPQMRSETLASFIMEPGRGVMHLAVGNPCENEYEELRL